MSEAEEIHNLQKSVKFQSFVVGLQSLCFLAALWLIERKSSEDSSPPMQIEQQANPQIDNHINPSPAAEIEAIGERQGHYTKSQFADLLDISVRTLERRIASGLVSPSPFKTESGEVRIDLDATMTR